MSAAGAVQSRVCRLIGLSCLHADSVALTMNPRGLMGFCCGFRGPCPNTSRVRAHLHPLPPTAQAVADVIGEDLTLRLCSLHESQRRYIPKNVSIHHPGARAIGVDQWQRIVRHFGGELIDLPSCSRAARQRAIKQHLLAGSSTTAVAARFGITRRHANRIAQSLRGGAAGRDNGQLASGSLASTCGHEPPPMPGLGSSRRGAAEGEKEISGEN